MTTTFKPLPKKKAPAKKKKRKPYFGKEVQAAIVYYLRCLQPIQEEITEAKKLGNSYKELEKKLAKTERDREKVFTDTIHPALNKLCENIIHKWKFYKYETDYIDLKTEAVSFLYTQLHKYNPDTGSKAYSYFTIVAKHFFIKKSQMVVKGMKTKADLDVVDSKRNLQTEVSTNDYQEILKDFILEWCRWIDINLEVLFKSKIDRRVANAIVEIFRSAGDLDVFNKKMIYIYIRESANIDNTLHITRVVKKLKAYFYEMFSSYRINGKLVSPL